MAISPRAGLSSGWLGVYRSGKNGGGSGFPKGKIQFAAKCRMQIVGIAKLSACIHLHF